MELICGTEVMVIVSEIIVSSSRSLYCASIEAEVCLNVWEEMYKG